MLVKRGLAVVISDLAEMGYDCQWCIVSASDCGAPHKRDRIWILATDSNLSQCERGSISGRVYKENTDTSSRSADAVAHSTQLQCNGSNNNAGVSVGSGQVPESRDDGWAQAMSDATSIRQQGQRQSWFGSDPAEAREGETDHAFAERVGHIWGIESPVGRVADGVAARVDRLKAIGNGQVPIVAATAWNILISNLRA